MKRVIFTIKPHSVVDLITNSSTELFVGLHNSKEILVSMIEALYPEYLSEYKDLKSTKELTNVEVETYLSYTLNGWSNREQRCKTDTLKGFSYDEMYNERGYLKYGFVNDENRERINASLDPDNKMFFLFSNDDNPNWDYQEKLMGIMTRYHLG